VKRVETEAEKARVQAEWEALHGCGCGQGCGRGCGRGQDGGTSGTTATAMAWDSNTDDAGEQILEGDPTLTDDDNIPITQMTTT
jgi:hypothetical protein